MSSELDELKAKITKRLETMRILLDIVDYLHEIAPNAALKMLDIVEALRTGQDLPTEADGT